MRSGTRTANPYVLNMADNWKVKAKAYKYAVQFIIMEFTLYHFMRGCDIQIGLRLVNLRFGALPPSQETGDPRFILDLSFRNYVAHIPHIIDRDSSREIIGLD